MSTKSAPAPSAMKRRLMTIARIGVAAALIVVLLLRLDLAALRRAFAAQPPAIWAAAAALILAGVVLSCFKLQSLLRVFQIRVGLARLFRIYMIGTFFNNFLPSTVGGDAYKYAALRPHGSRRMHVAMSIFMERYTGLLAVLILALLGVIGHRALFPSPLALAGVALLAGGGVAFALALVFLPPPPPAQAGDSAAPDGATSGLAKLAGRARRFLRNAREAGHAVGRDGRAVAASAVVSLIFVLDSALIAFVIARGLDQPIAFGQMLVAVCLIQLVTMLPLSINGIGVREWAHVLLLGRLGIAPEAAAAISLMTYFAVLAVSLLGGAMLLAGEPEPMPNVAD